MKGQTNLLASWETTEEDPRNGFRVVRISVGGDPHAAAILNAVVDRYNALSGRERPSEEALYDLVGQKVTLVESGENAFGGGILVAQEGKLFASSRGGYGILPKGARSKGYRVKTEDVLDVFPGYATAEAQAMVQKVREHFPILKPIDFSELPLSSETIHACFFGTHRLPDSTQRDAIYLASNYIAEGDIVEGVLIIRPEHGFSEHGSIWGRQILGGPMGQVVGFEPITFAEAIHLCDVGFEEAYEQILGKRMVA